MFSFFANTAVVIFRVSVLRGAGNPYIDMPVGGE
jgi:hypothetical protein